MGSSLFLMAGNIFQKVFEATAVKKHADLKSKR